MSIYDFEVEQEDGSKHSLKEYAGKVLVIVNTATKCGFAPQFDGLQKLYASRKDQGLMILGFPSNQFHQELDTSKDAAAACRTKYGVDFPMHQMTKVNGEDADPLFKYLKKAAPGALGDAIKWNFTKFLVDRKGNVVERFAPKTKPEAMEQAIDKLL